MLNMEETIRVRAYHMWTDAGRPQWNAESFWLSAQRELLAQSLGQIASVKAAIPKTPARAKAASSRKRKVA
jgi:hypothetical protein